MNKKILIALLLGFLLTVATACGSTDDVATEDTTDAPATEETEDIQEETDSSSSEIYTVAIDNSNAPFEYLDEDSGELAGFDVDLINALAKEAGIEIEINTVDFAGLIAGVSSGKFDMGIGGITITEERKKNIDFSDPYYESGLILAVLKDNDEIQSIDDVDGKLIATQQGSTSEDYLRDNTGAEIEGFINILEAYQNVLAGRAEAVLYDLPNVQYYSQKETGGELKTVGEKLTGEDYGVAFPKGSEIVETIDEALTALKENGTYGDIYEEWFGERPEEN